MQRCLWSPGLAGAQQHRCVLLPPLVPRWGCSSQPMRQHLATRPLVIASASPANSASASDSAPQQFSFRGFKPLPDSSALQLVSDSWSLVYSNIWAIVLIFVLKDAAAFLLHRFAHRLTNHLAEVLLGLPVSSMGNPWWIMVDPKFVEGNISYQCLIGVFFIICLPINILFNTAAVSTAAVVCTAPRPSAKPHVVPSATYTGQGRGKVGLAECRSSSSDDDGQCEEEWGQFDSSSSSSSGVGGGAVSAAAAGVASFRSLWGSIVSFRQQAAAVTDAIVVNGDSNSGDTGMPVSSTLQQPPSISTAVTAPADNKKQQQPGKQEKQNPPQPAAAPALPWLNPAQQKPRLPKPPGIRPSIAMVQEAWGKQVVGRLQQLWTVDILFNLRALPLQALCLAVLPVFWAFPKLMEIQLALPAAVLAGANGADALQRSRELMKGFKASYAWPFVLLLVISRSFELFKEFVLVSIPPRWWTDVIEVPIAATAFFAVVRLLLLRVQDLVPLAAYLYLQRKEKAAAAL